MFRRLLGEGQTTSDSAREPRPEAPKHDTPSVTQLENATFSVVDVETTGLSPSHHHRILEIAIVQVDRRGHVLDEFVTLVDPERDLGPTHIHGIEARDILGAPRFSDIAGDIAVRLAGNILVAHNIRFDRDFLDAEFTRIGYALPQLPSLCTLNLSRKLHPSSASHRLGALCAHYDIPLEEAHTAVDDARATATLLQVLLEQAGEMQGRPILEIDGVTEAVSPDAWPPLQESGRVHTRKHAASARTEPSYLARLVKRLANTPMQHDLQTLEYEDILCRALEDRRISEDEADVLIEVATQCGLSAAQVSTVHDKYLNALVKTALADGTITRSEQRDLSQVAGLMGYDAAHLSRLIQTTKSTPPHRTQAETPIAPSSQESLSGLTVCFTGDSMHVGRPTNLESPRCGASVPGRTPGQEFSYEEARSVGRGRS